MIDPFDLYNDFCSRVNTFQGGTFRLQSDFIRNVNAIYYDIWDRETRNARKSQESKDNCMAFLLSQNISVQRSILSNYGILNVPKNYGRLSSVRIVLQVKKDKAITIPDVKVNKGKCKGYTPVEIIEGDKYEIKEKSIDQINDDQWAGCLDDLIKFPTLLEPKMVQANGGFQVAPKEISVVVFSYYIAPKPASLNITYTEGDDQYGNGDEVIYNQNLSTPIMFPQNLKNEFLWKLCEIYGIANREQLLAAFGNEKTKQ